MELFIITAIFGQFSDHTTVDMFIGTNFKTARSTHKDIHEQMQSAFKCLSMGVRRPIDADAAIWDVAERAYWDGYITLVLGEVNANEVFSGINTLNTLEVYIGGDINPFDDDYYDYNFDEFTADETDVDEMQDMYYEYLALPYEIKYNGLKPSAL